MDPEKGVVDNKGQEQKQFFADAKSKRSEAAVDLLRFAGAATYKLLGEITADAARCFNDINDAYVEFGDRIINKYGDWGHGLGALGVGLAVPFEVLGHIPIYIAHKVSEAVAGIFGFEGFEPKNEPRRSPEARAITKNATDFLQKVVNSVELVSSNDFTPSAKIPREGGTTHQEDVAFLLKCCLSAVEKLPKDAVGNKIRAQILRGNVMPRGAAEAVRGLSFVVKNALQTPCEETTRGIQKYFERSYLQAGGQDLEAFRHEITKARGVNASKELTRTFKVGEHNLTEKTTNLDVSIGAKFLRASGGEKYQQQIGYMEEHPSGIRLSQERQEVEAQGMLTNGFVHSVTLESGESKSILRSGAFAVHDKKKIGLDGLIAKKAEIARLEQEIEALGLPKSDEALRAEMDRIGGDRAQRDELMSRIEKEEKLGAKIEEIQASFTKAGGDVEIKRRTDLTAAQALPKISASIKEMAKNPKSLANAVATGSFLHVEQSLLSDQDASERAMLEDMKGAMDYLKKNATIKLTTNPNEETVEVDEDGKIKLKLYVEGIKEVPDREFTLKTLLFTQGVNEQQSLGHLFSRESGPSYQDKVNLGSLEELLEYADSVVDHDTSDETKDIREKMEALKRHYSEANFRKGKDIEGNRLIDELVEALDAGRGVVCKSGKDRTGAEVSDSLAAGIAKKLGKDDEEKKALRKEAREKLAAGISHRITGINTGKRNGYAFNAGQWETLPEEWRPPRNLCSNNMEF